MTGRLSLKRGALALPLALAACAVPPGLSDFGSQRAGFATVSATTRNAIGKDTVWLQSVAEGLDGFRSVEGVGPARAA